MSGAPLGGGARRWHPPFQEHRNGGCFVLAGLLLAARRLRHRGTLASIGGGRTRPSRWWMTTAAASRSRAPARRVVSLVPSATETIVALGAADRLVGRTRYDHDPSVAAVPVVGGGLDPNLETMVGLAPDLVVSWFSDERPETRRGLDGAGIPSLSLSLQDTSDAFRAVTLMGKALGLDAEADRLLGRLRDSLAETRQRAAGGATPACLLRRL